MKTIEGRYTAHVITERINKNSQGLNIKISLWQLEKSIMQKIHDYDYA